MGDTTTNKYLDIYETYSPNNNTYIVGFSEIVMTDEAFPMPTFNTAPVAGPGTVTNAAKLTLVPNTPGNGFAVNTLDHSISSLQTYGVSPPTGSVSYTSGDNLFPPNATNTYFEIYELNSSGKTVAYKEVQVTYGMIAATIKTPSGGYPMPGSTTGSTKVAFTGVGTYTLQYVIRSSPLGFIPPMKEYVIPSGAVTYTSGNDITGVDATTNNMWTFI